MEFRATRRAISGFRVNGVFKAHADGCVQIKETIGAMDLSLFVALLFLSAAHGQKGSEESVLPGDENNGGPREVPTRPYQSSFTEEEVDVAVARAKHDIDLMFDRIEPQLVREFHGTPFRFSTHAWAELMAMDERSKRLSYSALISALATKRLNGSPETNWTRVSLAGSALDTSSSVCPPSAIQACVPGKYRSYSGHCNNVIQPFWGASHEPLQRLQRAAYADGVGAIRLARSGRPLINARAISRRAFSAPTEPHKFCTLLFAQWAQFVFEDMVHVGANQLFRDNNHTLPLPCCGAKHPECLPIMTDPNDEAYKDREHCLPYSRSALAPRLGCKLGPREQANLQTAFLDASHLYGSDEETARRLRSFRDGQLKVQSGGADGDEFLPARSEMKRCASNAPNQRCFDSASTWTNLLPTSMALHTLWMRQHNRVARELSARNGHWNDERLYQETRRIIIAQIQHITYNEFLPLLLGKEQMSRHGLQSNTRRALETGGDYDMSVNPGALNAYASAVGMFFFSLLPDTIAEVNEEGEYGERQHMSTLFNDPSLLYERRGRIDSILRFLIDEPTIRPGLQMSAGFRERFMRGHDSNGLDLAALLIQMGRDHGLNSYTEFREACGLSRPRTFDELRPLLWDSVNLEDLKGLYESVDDGDLFVLGLAERADSGALLGPTFTCLLRRQFKRTKQGDRFWYENSFGVGGFTGDQLTELRKSNLAAILCDNAKQIERLQPRVLERSDDVLNCPVDCNSSMIERLDLDAWIDAEPPIRLAITEETVEKALRMGAEQYRRFVEAERKKLATLGLQPNRTANAIYAHASYMAPKREALDRAKTAGILREATRILLRGEGLEEHEKLPTDLDVPTLQQLLPKVDVGRVVNYFEDYLEEVPNARNTCLPKPLPCDRTNRYRSPSGWCNNLRFPAYGNAFGTMRRLAPPAYDDGFDVPRARSVNGQRLPSPRKVSVHVHNDDQEEDVHFSHMLMQMGQLLDHDLTHSPLSRGPNNMILNCSTCDTPETLSIHCFPIPIEEDDPYFPPRHTDGSPRCIPMARSILAQVTLGYRDQLNQLTSFIDVSHVYGSSDCETRALRLHRDGLLNFTDLGGHNHEALPQGPQERLCHKNPTSSHQCFNAGDERNNIQPGLTAMHTIMLRDHNRIARQLKALNPRWDDERLFQESRRILIAKFQHIIYKEWLPVVLGCDLMSRHDLWPRESGYYDKYDPTCDAMMSQEFSIAAFRFGHTLIRNIFPRMNANYTAFGPGIELRENFNNATALYQPNLGHMEGIIIGLLGAPEMQFNRHASNAVRNHLFQYVSGPYTGLDLIAVNIQRGRDHGLPAYNSYRERFGMRKARDFDDLVDTMDPESIRALQDVYDHVDDIDLFSGMMSEKAIKGALIGPMIAHVVIEQFQRLKRCDRFYYETNDPYLRFTPAQLAEIRKSSFAKMICQNSQFAQRIPPNTFLLPDELTNAPIHCEELPDVDLSKWAEDEFCTVHEQKIPLGKTGRPTPCVTCTCTKEGAECHSMTIAYCDDLFKEFPLEAIRKDTVCLIQCLHEMPKN